MPPPVTIGEDQRVLATGWIGAIADVCKFTRMGDIQVPTRSPKSGQAENRMKFQSRHVETVVYLVGIVVLGLTQAKVRVVLGDGWSFAAVIAYLVFLRFLGNQLSKYLAQ
jgi:hypothetical protein